VPVRQLRIGRLELGVHPFDQSIEQLVLVLDVAIQRHRLDAQARRDRADGERVEPVGVGELECSLHHASARQEVAGARLAP